MPGVRQGGVVAMTDKDYTNSVPSEYINTGDGCTANEKLWALVERWENEHQRRMSDDVQERAWGMAHDACATDLRELIEDE